MIKMALFLRNFPQGSDVTLCLQTLDGLTKSAMVIIATRPFNNACGVLVAEKTPPLAA
jgi:hypothetical protein